MPTIVGPAKINSISGGAVNFGDSFYLSPDSATKICSGSGGSQVGDFHITNDCISITNQFDPDIFDQNQTANA
ncbi:spore germination protein [Bacillus carboniphilus]|uniref:Spore germination protein n=1 Tax=Bacillus carboniphilus TaxID=86663 RepID=A0ABY9JX65_9BACI|nr:spore germination protein [Bacillus carboniphilus]WLR42903.1 spore germination protein [Bacillus carboniphilus]